MGILGPLTVADDGRAIPIPRGMSRRLLLALVVQGGRPVDDDELVQRLWGDAAPIHAIESLRNYVTRLRHLLGEHTIGRENHGYLLNTEVWRTDVEAFDTHVAAARAAHRRGDGDDAVRALRLAFRLVRGTPLVEAADELWARPMAGAVTERICSAEELWAEVRLRDGLAEDAIARFHRDARAQPQREVRWRQLVRAYAQTGRRVEALRALDEARTALAEYGLVPGPELVALELDVLGSEPSTAVSSRARRRLANARRTVMVGRDDVVTTLMADRPVTWLSGESGLGKTRLLAETAGRMEDEGELVIYAPVERSAAATLQLITDLALGAVNDATVELSGSAELSALIGIAPSDGSTPDSELDPALRIHRLRLQLGRLLDTAADRRRVVVMVDDVQWIDETAVDLLAHLIERASPDVRWILAAQPQRHGLEAARLRAVLARSSPLADLDLEPFGSQEVELLVNVLASSLSGDDRARLAGEVLDASGGNPLFATELIAHRVQRPDDDRAPPRLDVLVAGILAELSDTERAVVDALAVAGPRCPLDFAAVAAGTTPDEVLRAGERLAGVSLVAPPSTELVELRHDLIRSAILQQLPPAAEREIRLRIVDALADDDRAAVVAAGHLLALGAPERARDTDRFDRIAATAMATLSASGDLRGAARLARDYLDQTPNGGGDRCALEARLKAAAALIGVGAVDEGRALLASVADAAHRLDDPMLLSDVTLASAPLDTGDPRLAATGEEVEAILDRLPADDWRRRIQLGCWAAHQRINGGHRHHALRLLDDADDVIRNTPSVPTVLRGLVLAMRAQAEMLVDAEPADLARSLAAMRTLADTSGDELLDAGTQLLSIGHTMATGTFADVRTARDLLAECARRVPRPDLEWWSLAIDAALALSSGDIDAAPHLIDEAERRGSELAIRISGMTAIVQRSQLALFDGSLAATRPQLTAEPGLPVTVLAGAGLARAVAGDEDGARHVVECLRGGPPPLRAAGALWPVITASLAELCWFTGDHELAARVADELAPWSGLGLAIHGVGYFGAVDRALGLLAAAGDRCDEAVELLTAAERQDRERGAVVWADRTAAVLATLATRSPG